MLYLRCYSVSWKEFAINSTILRFFIIKFKRYPTINHYRKKKNVQKPKYHDTFTQEPKIWKDYHVPVWTACTAQKNVLLHFSQSNQPQNKRATRLIATNLPYNIIHSGKLRNTTKPTLRPPSKTPRRKNPFKIFWQIKHTGSIHRGGERLSHLLTPYLPEIPCTEPPAEMLLSMPFPGYATPDTVSARLPKIRVSPRATLPVTVHPAKGIACSEFIVNMARQ